MKSSKWQLTKHHEIHDAALGLVKHLQNHVKFDRGREWTERNFNALRDFAQEIDSTLICFHKQRLDHKEDRGEFLWDFIASSPDQGIVLAAESEQETSTKYKVIDLHHDFEKLLYVFAPLRLLITKAKDEKDAEELAQSLARYTNGCCQNFNPGSAFILHFCLNDGGGSVSFIWQSEGSPISLKSETIHFDRQS